LILWNKVNPDLMTTVTALRQKLYIMRNRTSSNSVSEGGDEE